jgi:hypothetical protein
MDTSSSRSGQEAKRQRIDKYDRYASSTCNAAAAVATAHDNNTIDIIDLVGSNANDDDDDDDDDDSTVKKEANEKDKINGSFDGADNDIIKPEKEYCHNMTITKSENTTNVNCNSINFFNEWEDGNWCWERYYDKFLVSLSTVPSGNNSGDGRSRRIELRKKDYDSFDGWEDGNWCWEQDYDKYPVSISDVATTGNKHGSSNLELLKGDYKKDSDKNSISYPSFPTTSSTRIKKNSTPNGSTVTADDDDGQKMYSTSQDRFIDEECDGEKKIASVAIIRRSNIGSVKAKESLSHSLPIDDEISSLHGSDNEIIKNNSNYDDIDDDDERNKNVEDLNKKDMINSTFHVANVEDLNKKDMINSTFHVAPSKVLPCVPKRKEKIARITTTTCDVNTNSNIITQPKNDIAPSSTSDQNNNSSLHMDDAMEKTTKKKVRGIHKRRTRVLPNDKEYVPQGEGASGGTQGIGGGGSRNVSGRASSAWGSTRGSQFDLREENSTDGITDVTPMLVLDEDLQLLTNYLFYLMKQLRPCRLTEKDRTTMGGKRGKIKIGYGGFQCIHCADLPVSART